MSTQKEIDLSSLFSSESLYTVAAFAAFRIDRELDTEESFENMGSVVNRLRVAEPSWAGLLLRFRGQLDRPFQFMCELFMEYHERVNSGREASGDFSLLSDSQLEDLITATSNCIITMLKERKPEVIRSRGRASTVPFQCIEDYGDCLHRGVGKAMCSAALVICVLQCVIPFARGASGGGGDSDG